MKVPQRKSAEVEAFIRRQLDGHFFRMRTDSYGHVLVADTHVAKDYLPDYRRLSVEVVKTPRPKQHEWNEKNVAVVLELRELGCSWFEIAVRFGVHPKSVRNAVQRFQARTSGVA